MCSSHIIKSAQKIPFSLKGSILCINVTSIWIIILFITIYWISDFYSCVITVHMTQVTELSHLRQREFILCIIVPNHMSTWRRNPVLQCKGIFYCQNTFGTRMSTGAFSLLFSPHPRSFTHLHSFLYNTQKGTVVWTVTQTFYIKRVLKRN